MPSSPSNTTQVTGLATWILEKHRKWSENRQKAEEQWNASRHAFLGISDGIWKQSEKDSWRSNTFLNLTHQKVYSAYALVIDMLLQGGSVPFDLVLSPEDELIYDKADDLIKTEIDNTIEAMANRINQQMLDCHMDRNFMKLVMASAVYGRGYLKKIRQTVKTSRWDKVTVPGPDGQPVETGIWASKVTERVQPGYSYASIWEIYKDDEAEDIISGQGIQQVRMVSPHFLRSKLGKPMFLDDKILAVLGDARGRSLPAQTSTQNESTMIPRERNLPNKINTIRYLEHYGRAPREEVDQFEADYFSGKDVSIPSLIASDAQTDGDEVEVMITLADNEIIRYVRSEPEERPFLEAIWEEYGDEREPRGVADNIKSTQLVLNGCFRGLEENAKLSGNVVYAIKRSLIDKMPTEMKPGSVVELNEACDDVRKAIQPIVTPSVMDSLISLLPIVERYLDDDSLIPKISQGISVDKSQETAYELSQRIEKSGKYIGTVIRNFDERIIEPLVDEFYRYNMNDPEVTDGKGDFKVKALGFSSYQDRVVRLNKLQQFLGLVIQNPALFAEADVRYILSEIAKALQCDPDLVLKSITEKEQAEQAAQQQLEEEKALEMQAKQAETAKNTAQAQALTAKADKDKVETELAQAETVHRMGLETAEAMATPVQAPQGASPNEVIPVE